MRGVDLRVTCHPGTRREKQITMRAKPPPQQESKLTKSYQINMCDRLLS